jgi:putative ABC transport system substrate-binding protein
MREDSTMRLSAIVIMLVLALGCLGALCTAEAQQPVKVHRIGVLQLTSWVPIELRQELRELGYVEGQNLSLEVRSPEGRAERLAALADELVRLPVDLIVTHTTAAVLAARHATSTLPIVAAVMTDPVQAGIAESLAHPSGNITGSFVSLLELQAKRLELLKDALPGITRVAVFLPRGNQEWRTALERTARELGVELHPVEVPGPDDLEPALNAIAHGQAEALVVSDAAQLGPHTARIGAFVVEHRLPTIGASRQPFYLMAYSVRSDDLLWRRAAVFIDKILHGTRPSDLPMERAAQFELTIDLKVAQELGLTLSQSILIRADKVFPVSGVPLPERIRIVPPDRRVAPVLAAFSGKWFMTSDGGPEHILIVETIDPPHALVILAWGHGTVGAGGFAHPSNWFRLPGQFVEGTLQVAGPDGSAWSYRLQPDGTLALTRTWRGAVFHATMTRAQP